MKKQKLQVGDRAKIADHEINGPRVGQIVEILAEEKVNEFGTTFRARFIDSNEQLYLSDQYIDKLERHAVIKRVAKGKNTGQFRFVLIGDNHEPIGQSHPETYKKKAKAIQTLNEYFNDFKIVDES